MNNWNQSIRNEERKEDKPPYSRIFVVCSKQLREEDLRPPFEKFGKIEDLYMPRDRGTGESKGVAYIKYSKTSSAAAAIQELHQMLLNNIDKPLKVMVANSKHDPTHNNNEDRYKRLFIKVHKDASKTEIRQHFSAFGHVESVTLQKDRATDVCKGFAYVQFATFLDTAKAFEECDRKYRPVFATPKEELKRSRNSFEADFVHSSNSSIHKDNHLIDFFPNPRENAHNVSSLIKTNPQNYDTVSVTCSPQIEQKHIERLFNIIPGMVKCDYTRDTYNGYCKATVTYQDEKAAAYAVERLNNFEFPSGEIVCVKPDCNPLNKAANDLTSIVNSFKNALDYGSPDLVKLADAIAQASSLIKAATGKVEQKPHLQEGFCSVGLPTPQPMLNINSRVAQRCFIVCKPNPPPLTVLRDVFCRFGDLIDVSTFPNKTFGFAKYASSRAAQEAIKTLNGATVCGIKLKVLEADEKPTKDDDKMLTDIEHNEYNSEDNRKKMKLDETDT